MKRVTEIDKSERTFSSVSIAAQDVRSGSSLPTAAESTSSLERMDEMFMMQGTTCGELFRLDTRNWWSEGSGIFFARNGRNGYTRKRYKISKVGKGEIGGVSNGCFACAMTLEAAE